MKRGFTLVELMVTVAIIGILAAVSIPVFTRMRCNVSTGEVQGCVTDISFRMENYQGNRGVYPTSDYWNALGYDNGDPPDCGRHYEPGINATATNYVIYFKDTKLDIPCASALFDDDVWAVVSTQPGLIHVQDKANDKTTALPNGFTIPGL